MDSTVQTTSRIDGVVISELRQIIDLRGSVLHMFRCDAPTFTRFGECYFSEVFPGVVKAWKRHRIQTQNVAVPVGRARLVIYDDRQTSESRGQLEVFELGRPDAYIRVQIPPLVWYGFACTSKTPALIANCVDVPHNPDESEHLCVDHPKIPYDWAALGMSSCQ